MWHLLCHWVQIESVLVDVGTMYSVHGIPPVRNSAGTEFRRYGIPPVRNSVDTVFRRNFLFPYLRTGINSREFFWITKKRSFMELLGIPCTAFRFRRPAGSSFRQGGSIRSPGGSITAPLAVTSQSRVHIRSLPRRRLIQSDLTWLPKMFKS